MQMHSVETKVGTTIWLAASMIACSSVLWPGAPSSDSTSCSRWLSMFSIITVASSTRMPTASARPPSVITLMVWPSHDSATIEHRIDSGIEVAMISVERQEPRNSSTTRPVRQAAVTISCSTSETESRTKPDASLMGVMETPAGSVRSRPGSLALMPLTTASVEASPVFRTSISTDCWPCTSTMFCCGRPPRCTQATSRR